MVSLKKTKKETISPTPPFKEKIKKNYNSLKNRVRANEQTRMQRLILVPDYFFEKNRAKVLTKHQECCNFAMIKLLFYHLSTLYHERHEI